MEIIKEDYFNDILFENKDRALLRASSRVEDPLSAAFKRVWHSIGHGRAFRLFILSECLIFIETHKSEGVL